MSKTFEVVDYVENDDGSANIVFDFDQETLESFVSQGLCVLIDQAKDSGEWAICYEDVKDEETNATIALDAYETHALMQVGILTAIKKGIEYMNVKNNNQLEFDFGEI
jgi:hypothetical protein